MHGGGAGDGSPFLITDMKGPSVALHCSRHTFPFPAPPECLSVPPLYQAVQLSHGRLGARLPHVPHLHTALAPGVDVLCGAADGDSADHLAVGQGVELPSVAGDAGADEGVGWERHRLHLPVGADVEGVGAGREQKRGLKNPWVTPECRS